MTNQSDSQTTLTRPRGMRPPAAYWWAVAFDVLHCTLIVSWLRFSSVLDGGEPPWAVFTLFASLSGLGLVGLLLTLRRGSFLGWVLQLVVLCLAVGLAPLPGILWVPLMVAWCGPETRDWFDPPMEREFG